MRARIWQIGCSEDERVALELNLQLSQTFSRLSSNTARASAYSSSLALFCAQKTLRLGHSTPEIFDSGKKAACERDNEFN